MSMITPIKNLEIYAFADPAGSKGQRDKRIRARQAIVVIGIDHLVRVFVLHTWAGRKPASQFRDKIIATYDQWQPRRMGIEANAMQELFGDLVIAEARRVLNGRVRMAGIQTPSHIEKDFKIRTTIEPILNDGRLFVPEEAVELRAELSGFPTWHLKDLVDCLAMAIMLIPHRVKQERTDHELDALVRYLRDTGAPAAYIEQVIADGGIKDETSVSERRIVNG